MSLREMIQEGAYTSRYSAITQQEFEELIGNIQARQEEEAEREYHRYLTLISGLKNSIYKTPSVNRTLKNRRKWRVL